MEFDPLINSDGVAVREIVSVLIPPHPHDVTIAVEDGLRVAVTYGNTTRTFDAETGRWLGTSTDGSEPPTQPPRLRLNRIGPEQLAEIRAAAHRLVYGDDEPEGPVATFVKPGV